MNRAGPTGLKGSIGAASTAGGFFKVLWLMLPRFARVSPMLLAAFIIVCIAHGVARAALVPATQEFLDRAAGYSAQTAALPDVIAGLLLLGLAHLCRQLLHGVHHVIMLMYWRRAEGALSLGVHDKMSRVSPIDFEDTRILDDMNKAMQGKDEAVWFTGSMVTILSFYVPYFLFMAVYLINIKPELIALLLLVFAPTLLAHVLRARIFSEAEDRAAPVRREFDYYELCLTGREYFKETRILGAFSYFKKLYAESLAFLNKLDFHASFRASAIELCVKLLSLLGYIGILLMLFDLLMKGDITVGAFAAIFTSIEMVFSLMRELIIDNLGASAKNLGRVQNYLRFMQMPELGRPEADVPVGGDIELRGVSFSYPGAGQNAVDDVTATIRRGETVAIVGENGSGKTSLVRLITGLYLPDKGEVFHGKTNTKTALASALFKNISAVFQKYQRYQMTLGENICISDADVAWGVAGDAMLDMICEQAGLDMGGSQFADRYDTMLSREFDGVELSGGQWQRVAIARSFFRTHQLIVLDEPTAAVDPIEETKIYNRFAQISKHKTAIIVTHRLGSVRLADRILVMKQGKLIEQGAHGDLLNMGGEYARLYKSQEQWYV
ncbi:MAG: ABC transporter ATP-binding protein/permease [Oscillospiraceae bacterium]|nr:ABC transporter ATP-binding protein/permease [Oscillospiraceae bacterium]